MKNRRSPFLWSISIGTLFATQVRVSVFFPLLALILWYRLDGLEFALIFCGILFLSVLLHEFGHVLAARLTGGLGDD